MFCCAVLHGAEQGNDSVKNTETVGKMKIIGGKKNTIVILSINDLKIQMFQWQFYNVCLPLRRVIGKLCEL